MSCNPVCSPTRASVLTGLIPSRHGVHHWLLNGTLQMGSDAQCTISEFTTLPQVLSDAGYYCGLVGKWHLGDNLNPQEGFEYWVTMPSGLTKDFYDVEVIENGKVRKQPGYITEFWTDRAIRFLEAAKSRQDKEGRPFYLHLAYNGPYSLDPDLLTDPERSRNRHSERYAGMPMDSFPRRKPHQGLFKHTKELNNIGAMRSSAAQISGVDDGVGEVMDAIDRAGMLLQKILECLRIRDAFDRSPGIICQPVKVTRSLIMFTVFLHVTVIPPISYSRGKGIAVRISLPNPSSDSDWIMALPRLSRASTRGIRPDSCGSRSPSGFSRRSSCRRRKRSDVRLFNLTNKSFQGWKPSQAIWRAEGPRGRAYDQVYLFDPASQFR